MRHESSPLQAAGRQIICLVYSDVQLIPVLLWASGLCLIVAEYFMRFVLLGQGQPEAPRAMMFLLFF